VGYASLYFGRSLPTFRRNALTSSWRPKSKAKQARSEQTCLPYSLTLRMEAIRSSETSVNYKILPPLKPQIHR
jgi:hypothetical protein